VDYGGGRKKPSRRSWWVFVPVWGGAALLGTAYGAGWFDGLSNRLEPVEAASAADATATHVHFSYCKWGGGTNCVVDGDTFWIGGQKVRIAGIDAPETHDYRCASELELGERAARQLQTLLNSGAVTMTNIDRDRDTYGRLLRNVSVDGQDVGETLISAGVARAYAGGRRSWC
jgi:endonuclease YncB( thermonuclease family)